MRTTAVDIVESPPSLLPMEDLRSHLTEQVFGAPSQSSPSPNVASIPLIRGDPSLAEEGREWTRTSGRSAGRALDDLLAVRGGKHLHAAQLL